MGAGCLGLADGQSVRGSHDRGRGPPPWCQARWWGSALSQVPVCAVRLRVAVREQLGQVGLCDLQAWPRLQVSAEGEADGRHRAAGPQVLASVLPVPDLAGPVSNKGAEWALRFALTRGLIDTARKQGHNLLEALQHTPQAPAAQRRPPAPRHRITPSRKGHPNSYN